MEQKINRADFSSQRGESLIGLMSSLVIAAVVFTGGFSFFFNSLYHSSDIQSLTQAQMTAKAFIDLMSSDLRAVGSGMPLTQKNFSPLNASIGSAAVPIMLDASSTQISFRLNETGISTFLTASVQPSMTSRTFSVATTNGFQVGDEVFLSNFPSGLDDGLRGIIESLNANQITLQPSFTATSGAVFPEGSVLQPTQRISYSNTDHGVTRSLGLGNSAISMPGIAFDLTYLDQANRPLLLPLTNAVVSQSLAAITIGVSVNVASRFDKPKRAIVLKQVVALRNLNVSR